MNTFKRTTAKHKNNFIGEKFQRTNTLLKEKRKAYLHMVCQIMERQLMAESCAIENLLVENQDNSNVGALNSV